MRLRRHWGDPYDQTCRAPGHPRDISTLSRPDLPDIAERWITAVSHTVEAIAHRPEAGSPRRFNNPLLTGLRVWPVKEFKALRVYYRVEPDMLVVLRFLHDRRDIGAILETEDEGERDARQRTQPWTACNVSPHSQMIAAALSPSGISARGPKLALLEAGQQGLRWRISKYAVAIKDVGLCRIAFRIASPGRNLADALVRSCAATRPAGPAAPRGDDAR
ncbi:type II toxin-antitoxin system RelE/ParE family toxin [Beijerinckia sp. L45]|uniref:type II toxin-antitoxin system RelE/ParE family toxin n=1 Tax=Beijerinckia sp. L45 TaxID=1641855 RepID=UPI00131D27DD